MWLYTDLLQALKGECLSSVFSPDGTLISASTAPHCGELIQTIWIHTTKHHRRHRRHGERHGNPKWKGVIEHWSTGYSQCFSVISIFWYNFRILQHKQTYLFLSYFSWPAIIQTNSSLAWKVVQKYVHGWTRIMKPRCHWFIQSLTFRTKRSNHRVI